MVIPLFHFDSKKKRILVYPLNKAHPATLRGMASNAMSQGGSQPGGPGGGPDSHGIYGGQPIPHYAMYPDPSIYHRGQGMSGEGMGMSMGGPGPLPGHPQPGMNPQMAGMHPQDYNMTAAQYQGNYLMHQRQMSLAGFQQQRMVYAPATSAQGMTSPAQGVPQTATPQHGAMGPPQIMPAPPMMRQFSQPNMPMQHAQPNPVPRPRSSHAVAAAQSPQNTRPLPSPMHVPSPLAQDVFTSPNYPSPMQRLTNTPQGTQPMTSTHQTPGGPLSAESNHSSTPGPQHPPQPMQTQTQQQQQHQLAQQHHIQQMQMQSHQASQMHPQMHPSQQQMMQNAHHQGMGSPMQQMHPQIPQMQQMQRIPGPNFPSYTNTEMPPAFPFYMDFHARQDQTFAQQYYLMRRRNLTHEYPKGEKGVIPQEPMTFGYLPDSLFYNAQLAAIVPTPPVSTQTTSTTTTTKGKGTAKAPAQKKPRATAASKNRANSNASTASDPSKLSSPCFPPPGGMLPMGMPQMQPMNGHMMGQGPMGGMQSPMGGPPMANGHVPPGMMMQHPGMMGGMMGPGGQPIGPMGIPLGSPSSHPSPFMNQIHPQPPQHAQHQMNKKPDFSPITPTSTSSEIKQEDMDVQQGYPQQIQHQNGRLQVIKTEYDSMSGQGFGDFNGTMRVFEGDSGSLCCAGCGGRITENDPNVKCCGDNNCGQSYHQKCSKLSDKAFTMLKSEMQCEWICDRCFLRHHPDQHVFPSPIIT
ncbi:unnamed protein product, partial [Mesorhabditis belari]|uniref:PHD-type domain-containing protein n=1 Tax=Mesorhabditis belari TaxID=2138241 RepID=A0AAF3FMC3_9BILA